MSRFTKVQTLPQFNFLPSSSARKTEWRSKDGELPTTVSKPSARLLGMSTGSLSLALDVAVPKIKKIKLVS